METLSRKPKNANLEKYGLLNVKDHWNLDGETLQQITLQKNMGVETENGTLCVNTGKFTGRSPKDRFIVKDEYTTDKVWWGRINQLSMRVIFKSSMTKWLTTFRVKRYMLEMPMYVPTLSTEQMCEPLPSILGPTTLSKICSFN